ncbi:MAG TPA: 2-amino-4-hydroxy-6-hydroxymethyldihydropteridine diphosphokinase, partial [Caulobacteraceae bacterium]|nr:2-amino-4-hydroxy-6-hydroxymethyldihydropteridine diphosphokinase [Caulobacteraceae bacterium]
MKEVWSDNTDDLTVLALGGNLPGAHGSVAAELDAAILGLAGLDLQVVCRSAWWRSAAWPDPNDPPFLNGVALVHTSLSPLAILTALRGLEVRFGVRGGARNSPRVLDLDLIACGRIVRETPELTLPHPRAAERYFVMGPLAQIAPDWVHPVLGQSAQALAATA